MFCIVITPPICRGAGGVYIKAIGVIVFYDFRTPRPPVSVGGSFFAKMGGIS